ncbi:hypothetical protein PENTCL1PPCAC_24223 [Pristionchus entomophagus]|uniref:Uncharacterized protein n=1 Tax=Pristionchus entomophagus TaxID=358040 RepID=A0AAV5U7E5_9BILA|nr:hypothetical protein PENTCL1PPCAC_24223 [Pristionchus entomophagus]
MTRRPYCFNWITRQQGSLSEELRLLQPMHRLQRRSHSFIRSIIFPISSICAVRSRSTRSRIRTLATIFSPSSISMKELRVRSKSISASRDCL